MRNYTFDTLIEKEVLENYLSRAATAAFLIHSNTLKDDLRAIKNLGIKFLGRAAGIWYPDPDDEEHFKISEELAGKVHEIDPEIILQACIFEAVYRPIERIRIPALVFEAFGMAPEDRCFSFDQMRFPKAPDGFWWGEDEALPDITQLETRLWFYYRAVRYIDAGYEALHLGQIHLYTADDRGMVKMEELMEKIRSYARIRARRHLVLMDAHSHGISIRGKLLLDYHAMPFTRYPVTDRSGDRLVLVREGFSEGGLNPNGFRCSSMPYLMEYDNWGGKVLEYPESVTEEERAWKDWWGYDQIGWFANQTRESQRQFLEYTALWSAINHAFFEIPFRRPLETAAVSIKREDNGQLDVQDYYQINQKSPDCPMGFSQEETVKRLWESEEYLGKMEANPENLNDYGAKDIFDGATGMKLPERVVVYGSFQPYVGAVKNDSNSEVTRMYFIGENTYALSIVIPFAGEYDYAVSTYGTLSATYSHDAYPRSGSSNKGFFSVLNDNTVVRFVFQFMDHSVTIRQWDLHRQI
nr:hypothetical protein [uncultured Clostridium sp.]